MAEDVEIKVKQTAEGNSIAQASAQVDALRKRIEDLRKAADAYGQKGLVGAEQTARQDARALERDLAALTRQRAQGEKEITQERRQQDAVARAQGTGAGGIGSGSVGALAGRFLTTAAVAATVQQLVRSLARDIDETALSELGTQARGRGDKRELALQKSYRGSAAGGQSARDATDAEIFELENKRADLEAKSKPLAVRALNAVTGGDFRTLEGARAIAKLEREITRNKEKRFKQEEDRPRQFALGPAQEIAQQKAIIDGKYKEALAIGQASEAFKRYEELKKQGGTEEVAKEGAGLSLVQAQREQLRAASGAIGARTSGAASARFAGLAAGLVQGGAGEKLDKLIGVVEAGNQGVTTKDFTRR